MYVEQIDVEGVCCMLDCVTVLIICTNRVCDILIIISEQMKMQTIPR